MAEARDFLFSITIETSSGTHPTSSGYQGSSWEVKWLGHEVDHSPPSSARVKNEWRCTCIPPACLGGMNRDSFLTCFNMVHLHTGVLISP